MQWVMRNNNNSDINNDENNRDRSNDDFNVMKIVMSWFSIAEKLFSAFSWVFFAS